MGEVAEHLRCDASKVTGLADRLAKADLVERVGGVDRRVKHLQLTSAGVELRENLADVVAAESTVMAHLSEAQRGELAELLDVLLSD